MPVVRSSLPMRRAAILPSPIRRRVIRSSHEQLQYSIYYEDDKKRKLLVEHCLSCEGGWSSHNNYDVTDSPCIQTRRFASFIQFRS